MTQVEGRGTVVETVGPGITRQKTRVSRQLLRQLHLHRTEVTKPHVVQVLDLTQVRRDKAVRGAGSAGKIRVDVAYRVGEMLRDRTDIPRLQRNGPGQLPLAGEIERAGCSRFDIGVHGVGGQEISILDGRRNDDARRGYVDGRTARHSGI